MAKHLIESGVGVSYSMGLKKNVAETHHSQDSGVGQITILTYTHHFDIQTEGVSTLG